ncbi:LPS export ABC transporter permease LptG [Thioalkalicoccus limnaeus]|uniref:LPS export ABC transporter permease LptG n=1 Tax=Thioalkalicoccus limnaeus TaxID=120681 RepID=A0ABV4BH04_9GAMM
MRILDRYIAGAVIGGTFMALAALLPLIGFFILADEIDQIGERDYHFVDALIYVALNMPRYLYQVFPIATLIGALIGLGSLAARSELVAMRAAGLSIGRIVFAAIQGGILLTLVAVAIGEVVAPFTQQQALQMRTQALTGHVMQRTPSGVWARDGLAFVNIREVVSGGHLRDIHIYELAPDQALTLATHAREARFSGGHWTLEEIARSHVSPEGVQVERIDLARWDSLLDPRLLEVIVVEPQALPVWDLYRYIRYLDTTEQDARAYQIALWAKIAYPVLILAMILVAIPILVGSARTPGLGPQIVAGIVIGVLFYIFSRTLVYLSLVFHLDPMLAAVLPPLLFLLSAFWLLRRIG